MALTKIGTDIIADDAITADKIAAGALDTQLAGYLSTNSFATETYVGTAISNLVDSSPATLDTLNELAAALGDDPNFATTTATAIGTKLPLAGGTMTGNLNLADNVKAQFGTGNDLQIYHDGSNSYATSGTGQFFLTSSNSNIWLRGVEGGILSADGSEYLIRATSNGSVKLYHNNVNKLETTTTGIDVTGTVTADGLTVVASGSEGAKFTTNDATAANNAGILIYNIASATAATRNAQLVLDPSGANAAGGDYLIISAKGDNSASIINYHATSTLALGTAGTERVNILANGNVGIGTDTPSNRLHIEGPTSSHTALQIETTTSGFDPTVHFVSPHNSAGMYLDGTVDNKIKFYNGYGKGAAGREITFDNSGNVGIGTTAPAAKLEISFGATGINNGVASLTNISGLSGAFSIIHNQDSAGTGNQVGQFFGHAGSPGLLSGIVSRKNSGTWATNLDFYVNNLTGGDVGSIQKAMTIDSSGNVGIGTTSPFSKLEVAGMADDAYTATAFNDKPAITIRHSNTSTTYGGIRFSNSIGNYEHFFGSVQTGTRADMVFQGYNPGSAAYQEHMRIKDTGNVGIGTADPTHTLNTVGASGTSVVQSIRNPNTSWSQYALTRYGTEAADFRYMDFGYYRGATEGTRGLVIKSQADATLVTFLDTGNVGIGTTNPANKFGINRTSINTNERMINLYTGTTGSGNYVSIGAQYAVDNALSNSEIRFGNEVQSSAPSFLAFATGNTSTPTERMRITSGGDIRQNPPTGSGYHQDKILPVVTPNYPSAGVAGTAENWYQPARGESGIIYYGAVNTAGGEYRISGFIVFSAAESNNTPVAISISVTESIGDTRLEFSTASGWIKVQNTYGYDIQLMGHVQSFIA
jgi:hypothetical protein